MKASLIFLLMLFSTSFASAQKIVVNNTDKFTGSKLIETSVLKTSRPNVDYRMRNINDTLYLCAATKGLKIDIDENTRSKMYIITVDGVHVNLDGVIQDSRVEEYHSGVHWGYGISTGTTTHLTDVELFFLIPRESFSMLCTDKISDIRISIGNENLDYEVDEFIAKKFLKLFNLLKE